MAGILRGEGDSINQSLVPAAKLYEQPVLIIDPGMHTAAIHGVGVDAANRIAVTGALDKTVRVWSLPDGQLQQTIRIPAGPGNIGQIYAVAMHPDGALVAAGGWTGWTDSAPEESIYVFETLTGKMAARIAELPSITHSLAFSPDGRYLAAGLENDLRVYDRDRYDLDRQWGEVVRDADYGDRIFGVTFSADGALATTSYDGKVRLYDHDFRLVVPPRKVTGGSQPYGIAFSPDGALLAIGYNDAPTVDLFDGHSLAPLPGPDVEGLSRNSLPVVTWSRDGRTLYAGGGYWEEDGNCPVLAWTDAGRGARRALPAGSNTVSGLAALPDGRLLVAAQDPFLGLLEPNGRPRWVYRSPIADFRDQEGVLAVSADGAIVEFGFELFGKSRLRLDLHALKLTGDPPADRQTIPPKQAGLAVERWNDSDSPTLDGRPIELEMRERSQSLAIAPDSSRFVLGSYWYLRALDAKGQQIWRRASPDVTWAVNISGDGRLAIGAYGDGTIRWHRLDDGRELLALYVLADKQNWVAWTPEGFYGATAGAFGLLHWLVNRGFDAAPDTVPVNTIPRLRRPDALALVLQELETARPGHCRLESCSPGRANRHQINEGPRRPAACVDDWHQRIWRQGITEPQIEFRSSRCTGRRQRASQHAGGWSLCRGQADIPARWRRG